MKIKICGLKEIHHAVKAAELGADFLGFVFTKSPRRVRLDLARDIIRELPPSVAKVGVFVDEAPETVNSIADFCWLDYVQLHGQETPEYCMDISRPVIKAFRIKDATDLDEIKSYRDVAEMFLLDAYVPGTAGGTGKTFDWSIARQAGRYGKIILAGGLTPENVRLAAAAAQPYGVDVSSGVETGGIKDLAKIAAFMGMVRGRDDVFTT